ncbi:MAG: hypothetical protein AAGG48_18455 [Planctomycetota bacterium]
MNIRQFVFLAAAFCLIGTVNAQEPMAGPADANEAISLFETGPDTAVSPSQSRPSKMSVAELRQQRGLYKANQRMARIQYNLWIGHEPLRPRFNSVPMMSSRYQFRRLYVPVYIRP